jgi:hypothetical protein
VGEENTKNKAKGEMKSTKEVTAFGVLRHVADTFQVKWWRL